MLYEASHDNIEKVSDQAWNHIADTQIKAFLSGFCFGLLSVFFPLSLCCPGCLFLIVTLKWQYWRGDEASVVLAPLQNMLELMCTDSSGNGDGETLACPEKTCPPGRGPIKWQTPGTASVSEKLPPALPFSGKESYCVCVGLFNTKCCQLLCGWGLDMVPWWFSHSHSKEDASLAQLPTTYVMETMSNALEACVC